LVLLNQGAIISIVRYSVQNNNIVRYNAQQLLI